MKHSFKLLLLLLILDMFYPVYAEKIILGKLPGKVPPKIHPYTHLLAQNHSQPNSTAKLRNDRLLVILVDFEEETTDDPNTTGNGKFLLQPDPEYLTTIGSPPHDREYFQANLEALKYYYTAVSRGSFNLQYDVFPNDRAGYTLPHPMSYYSPAGAGSELFLSRIEEYFKEAFETADASDPEIDFAVYSHFMIIHAGSDWQHDVRGDTPSDLPSFFIRIAPGKEAVVDNGAVQISHACNVPSTIAQDFDSYTEGENTYHSGYGALNGVLAHEFGHSLGMVDLYSTYNSQPMVGQFDIMDSGGSGISVVGTDQNGVYVLVEGAQPCLPGAYSIQLAFGSDLTDRGFIRELEDTTFFEQLQLCSSSKLLVGGTPIPAIYKFPLNANEYILIENRSVDPDGDGGTAVHGTLNQRVILYPTAFDDPTNTPTYEYDYLLPSFVDASGNAIGGGILVWKVDNEVLYRLGDTNSSGEFVNNFVNNTVNGNYRQRGVMVIEADGLEDVGYDYSWYWTGTPYEYFHTYKPNLNLNGQFVSWSTQEWRPNLNACTVPPLRDYAGHPSLYGLADISQPDGVMTFSLTAGDFTSLQMITEPDTAYRVFPVINSNLAAHQLPVYRHGYLHFYTQDAEQWLSDWTQVLDSLQVSIPESDFPPVVCDADHNGYQELYLTHANQLTSIQISNDQPDIRIMHPASTAQAYTGAPLFFANSLFIPTKEGIHRIELSYIGFASELVLPGVCYHLAATDQNIVAVQNRRLVTILPGSLEIAESFDLPESSTIYQPVMIKNAITGQYSYFVFADTGNLYSCSMGKVSRIFVNSYPGVLPTNLAISEWNGFSPVILFGIGNRIIALEADGSLLKGYPHYLENYEFTSASFPKIKTVLDAKTGVSTQRILLNAASGGFIAFHSNQINDAFGSNVDLSSVSFDQIHWDSAIGLLQWLYVNSRGNVVCASWDSLSFNPFTWNGFRGGDSGFANLGFIEGDDGSNQFSAFAYPNPARGEIIRIKSLNYIGNLKLNIYNVGGTCIYQSSLQAVSGESQDFQIDVSDFSSGVYIAVVQDSHATKRIKFAVEK